MSIKELLFSASACVGTPTDKLCLEWRERPVGEKDGGLVLTSETSLRWRVQDDCGAGTEASQSLVIMTLPVL